MGILLEELKEITDWRMLGAYLDVPKHVLDRINKEQSSVEHCKLEMLQHWLDNTMTASWNDIARALEQINQLKIAARLKLKYLRTSPAIRPDGMCECICVCMCVCVCVCMCARALMSVMCKLAVCDLTACTSPLSIYCLLVRLKNKLAFY